MLCQLALLVAAKITVPPADERKMTAAQLMLKAAVKNDKRFAIESGGHTVLQSTRIVVEGFTFWTTGLDVDVEEEEDHPPHEYVVDDEEFEDDDQFHTYNYYAYDDYRRRKPDYWNSFDRFAGSKTHSTVFAGFANARLDMADFEYAGKCPIPDCGDYVYQLADDEIDDPTGIREALTSREDALDMEHVYDASGGGGYGGASPDELMVRVCSKGCMYGTASAHLTMAGKLGWAAGSSW